MNSDSFVIKIWIFVFLFLAASLTSVEAQNSKDDEIIKVDTLLVNIPVIASDRDGRYIAGLKKENFFIIEDGVKRNVDFFADEESPMNVAVLIDTSFSTRNVLGEIIQAAHEFVKTLRPEDKGMIVSFDFKTTILTDFTSDQKKLSKAVNHINIAERGGSDMQDAIYDLVTENFASVKGRKAIIVLTDGNVAGFRVSNQKLLNTLIESDVLIYPILFNTEITFPPNIQLRNSIKLRNGEVITAEEIGKRIEIFQKQKRQFMNGLAVFTGGRLYEANSKNFKKTFNNITDELKKQYVVGFYPTNINNEKSHRIVVEVMPKETVIRIKSAIRLKSAN